jgi:hypothetical protein
MLNFREWFVFCEAKKPAEIALQLLGGDDSLLAKLVEILPSGIKADEKNKYLLIASYFYGCSRAVCDIISLITIADGMISSIFLEYYADKKKSPEWNKKEAQRYMQIMKSFAHPMGDFMTLLKVYRMYMKVVEQLPEQPDNQLDIDNQVDDVLLELGEPLPQNQQAQQTQQVQQSVNKWCKDNYVHSKRMAQVRRTSRQLYETLQKALQPMQQHHKTKKDQEKAKFASVDEVMSELEPELPPIALRHSRETKKEMVSYYKSHQAQQAHQAQVGGFIKRIEKQQKMDKLEANVKRFATEDENIMMSLAIGNFVNFAVKAKQGDNVYVSCFAQTKKFAKVNKDSFLNTYPKIVMYDEMFMSSRDAKFLKLNIVGKIPDNVFARIKELYGQYIKYCV